MNKPGKLAAEILQRKLKDNPKLPGLTRHVMQRLASGDEASKVWKVFGEDEKTINRVIRQVRTALEFALKEISRPKIKNESVDIDKVIKLAKRLKTAIQTSSLPGNLTTICSHKLTNTEGSVSLDVGWHSLQPGRDYIGYPLAVCDVLDWAVEIAEGHVKSLPPRSLTRAGKINKPEVSAFVRHLAWQFAKEFGQEKPSTIGYITTAIFDLADNPLDAKDVQAILKDRPEPFIFPTT